jgi:hypothetical protein
MNNELHLVEYNPYLGAIACHQILSTPMVIHKVAEDRDTSGTFFIAGRDNGKEVFVLGRVSVDSMREINSKEDLHRLSKEIRNNKAQFVPTSISEVGFRIKE